jgi:hypothetical protein
LDSFKNRILAKDKDTQNQQATYSKLRKNKVPSTMPKNPLQLESVIFTISFVPWRMLELELTSFTASSMAILATLPMVEFNVKTAPIFTTAGLEETFLLNPFGNNPKWRNSNKVNQIRFILNKWNSYLHLPQDKSDTRFPR